MTELQKMMLSGLLVMGLVSVVAAEDEARAVGPSRKKARTYDHRVKMHAVDLGQLPVEEDDRAPIESGMYRPGASSSLGADRLPTMSPRSTPYLPPRAAPEKKKSKNWILPISGDESSEQESQESGWGWLADNMLAQQKEAEQKKEEQDRPYDRPSGFGAPELDGSMSPESIARTEEHSSAITGPVSDLDEFEREDNDLFVSVLEDDRVNVNPDRRREEEEEKSYDNPSSSEREYSGSGYFETQGAALESKGTSFGLPRTRGMLEEATRPMKTEMAAWRHPPADGAEFISAGKSRQILSAGSGNASSRPFSFSTGDDAGQWSRPTGFGSAPGAGLSRSAGNSFSPPTTAGSGGRGFEPVLPVQPTTPTRAIGTSMSGRKRRIYTVQSEIGSTLKR